MKTVARLAAVQATYMVDYGNLPVDEVVKDFVDGKVGRYAINEDLERDIEEPVELSELDTSYFASLVKGVHKNKEDIEKSIDKYLEKDFTFERFDGTLQALLLCAIYEIIYTHDVDVKVIIKEYVDLAYAFFTKKEPKMVNAILDKIAKTIR
ncbi:MAG: transcription antitermination factor NusB [Lactobacillaceae bacterium]|nr:transcription antitermination factor NusB [Lactobacillaceae bacterium]